MTATFLYRIDLAKRMQRYYRLDVQPYLGPLYPSALCTSGYAQELSIVIRNSS